ncbi:MAG: hypothetical protein CMD33_00255 [Flavobacteriales bacterium]|mgnify:CR=1 FL=1|nr:hypothetical protein [Flavobacteriales bacterium]
MVNVPPLAFLLGYFLTLFCTASGQVPNWTHDLEWAEEGWSAHSLGEWHDVVDVVPWQNYAAAAVNVYSEDGSFIPYACRWDNAGGLWHWPLKTEGDSTQYSIAALDVDASGQLWAIGSQQQNEKGWASDWAIWPVNEGNLIDTTDALYVNFGSPFQAMLGWDVSPSADVWGAAMGYVLDPCCFHRELPVLVEVSSDHGVTSVVFDVGNETTMDTLGMRPAHQRHEVGGAYYCAVPSAEGGWIAAGAYSNAAHYEVLVAKHSPDGSLDEAFGESGWIHMNLNPDVNHWVADAILIDGQLYLQIQSHSGGELNPGWHQLVMDAQSGELLNWESLDGVVSVHTDGYHEGAETSVGFYDAEEPRVVDPTNMSQAALTSAIDSGNWTNIKTTYHGDWGRWITVGQRQQSGATSLAASRWLDPVLGQASVDGHVAAPFPNPLMRGGVVHLPAPCVARPCELYSVLGAQVWSTPVSAGNGVALPEFLTAGTYILRSVKHATGWRLVVQ